MIKNNYDTCIVLVVSWYISFVLLLLCYAGFSTFVDDFGCHVGESKLSSNPALTFTS